MSEIHVHFYKKVADENIKFVVIAANYQGQWVFVKHKERNTYEIAGGKREIDETCIEAAKRELMEETGAIHFTLEEISVYSVIGKTRVNVEGLETYGMLYFSEIETFGEIKSEIEKRILVQDHPESWTYPDIQPKLLVYVKDSIKTNE